MRARKRLLALVVLLCAAAVGGCGRSHVSSGNRTLELAVTEYRLIPQSARVKAGELLILVHNYGRAVHNLVITGNGISLGATNPIFPGDSATLAVFLAKGRYLMQSNLISDEALGAYGTLIVTS